MPPDSARPTGAYALPAKELVLGDTQGRTPGSYCWIVSCYLTRVVGPQETIVDARLVLTRLENKGINFFSDAWTSDAGPGPAVLEMDMVRACPPYPCTHSL
jgi:hypothetical protein